MTIAAGYVCDSGIIICADTQETIPGYTKNSTHKLTAFQTARLSLIFAGAGNNATQIDETAHEIGVRMSVDDPKGENEFSKSLRKTLEELFPKAYYPRREVEVDMLMAVKGYGMVRLYRISDCNVAPVRDRAAVGMGVILALQLLERHYDSTVQVSEAAIICTYVLHHVKKWVDGCGGNTEIALIPRSGREFTFMPSDEVDKIEAYCKLYDDALRGLLLAAPRTPKNKEQFMQHLKLAENGLLTARTTFQDWEDTLREVAHQLGISYEEIIGQ